MMLLLRDGRSPLLYAVCRGNRASVRRLLESGADAGIQHDGFTILNMAVAQGDEELCLAAYTGRANIIQLLLDHGADINEEDDCG
ncbi:hypothetical protein BDV18DRAFT_152426 [Aspergillus unguis]